jgi:predicted DCC family thiol-disulfide oxidoreductase YuxK
LTEKIERSRIGIMPTASVVTTYYNGACPACRREIEHYRRLAERAGDASLAFCDVAREPAALAGLGIEPETAKRRIHLVDEAGRLHVGADAFIVLWDRMPRYRWLARLARLPMLRPLAAWGYEHVVSAAFYRWARRRERGGGAG